MLHEVFVVEINVSVHESHKVWVQGNSRGLHLGDKSSLQIPQTSSLPIIEPIAISTYVSINKLSRKKNINSSWNVNENELCRV